MLQISSIKLAYPKHWDLVALRGMRAFLRTCARLWMQRNYWQLSTDFLTVYLRICVCVCLRAAGDRSEDAAHRSHAHGGCRRAAARQLQAPDLERAADVPLPSAPPRILRSEQIHTLAMSLLIHLLAPEGLGVLLGGCAAWGLGVLHFASMRCTTKQDNAPLAYYSQYLCTFWVCADVFDSTEKYRD